MKKQTLCCIGHITLDKVVTPQSTVYMPGGTAYYCSYAMRHLNNTDYRLVTAVGESELNVVERMRNAGINVTALPSKHSVYFENIYGENQNDRTQRVLAKADPFTSQYLKEIEADIFATMSLGMYGFELDDQLKSHLKGNYNSYIKQLENAGKSHEDISLDIENLSTNVMMKFNSHAKEMNQYIEEYTLQQEQETSLEEDEIVEEIDEIEMSF